MRILNALTYYAPHISGLSIFARRLNRRLVEGGDSVTVLTAHFDHSLPASETIEGTAVTRSPVLLRLSKGVLMPLFPWHVFQLMRKHDIAYLHLPQVEASVVAVIAKVLRRPVIVQYQCDIVLPSWRARLLVGWAIRLSHGLACLLADRIVVITEDYARNSRLLRRFLHKTEWVLPPIEAPEPLPEPTLRNRRSLGAGPLIGFVGRLAEEKGIDTLLDALPLVRSQRPGARLIMAGLTDAVPGERRAHARLTAKMDAAGDSVVHLGAIDDNELWDLYRSIDVLALPSTNSTESFGMTQAEAMLAGTPVVTSDLPGVREAVRITGMGEVVPPRNEQALAAAIVRVMNEPNRYARSSNEIRTRFDPEATAEYYRRLFSSVCRSGVQGADEASLSATGDTPARSSAKRS